MHEPPRLSIDTDPAPASVTICPLVTYLIVFDFIVGFFAGLIALVICDVAGAPTVVIAGAALLSGAVVWAASWLRTSIRFTADQLVFTGLLRAHRIPWDQVLRVTLQAMYEHDTDEVTQQRLEIRYSRGNRFGLVTLPLLFPPDGPSPGVSARGWPHRRADRQRQIIRQELAAHGHPLPG